MSLEEIESNLGALIRADTVQQLKSSLWTERLEAMLNLKGQVESIHDLNQSVEILIRLLCAVPGFNEENVQVQQQVIEVIMEIASRTTKFPKQCVVLCLVGISEQVADINTRSHAKKCLTTFTEAVGPGFIFERLFKITKEHKNPKVLSENIHWMATAVEDFGVSDLKLKDLIDFCKVMGHQSCDSAIRNATDKLFSVLHKLNGQDIKGYLSDVEYTSLGVLVESETNMCEDFYSEKTRSQSRASATRNATTKILSVLDKFVGQETKWFLLDDEFASLSALATKSGTNLPEFFESMEAVWHEFSQAPSDPEGFTLDYLLRKTNRYVYWLANMLANSFSSGSWRDDFSKFRKDVPKDVPKWPSWAYVLNRLLKIFVDKRWAHVVKERTLYKLITAILTCLSDGTVAFLDNGDLLLKTLNCLMENILDNAQKKSLFVILIDLLRPIMWPLPPKNEPIYAMRPIISGHLVPALRIRHPFRRPLTPLYGSFSSTDECLAIWDRQFSGLVVLYLTMITEDLQSTTDLDLERILQSIHTFLEELGRDEIIRMQQMASPKFMLLARIKILLKQLVKLKGTAIKGHLSLVPVAQKPRPFIICIIEHYLQVMATSKTKEKRI